jgi:hypothetical protein
MPAECVNGTRLAFLMAILHAVLSGATAAQQRPPPTLLDATLGDPTGLVLGVGGGVVTAGGEAFDFVATGYAVQIFAGAAMAPFDELRAGVALSSHPDDLSDDRVKLVSIYLEPYVFASAVGPVTVRMGPRVAWMQESRSIFVKALRGIGLGGIIGTQLWIGARSGIETAVVITPYRLGAADIQGAPPDPDRQSYGLVLEVRLGFAFRFGERSRKALSTGS